MTRPARRRERAESLHDLLTLLGRGDDKLGVARERGEADAEVGRKLLQERVRGGLGCCQSVRSDVGLVHGIRDVHHEDDRRRRLREVEPEAGEREDEASDRGHERDERQDLPPFGATPEDPGRRPATTDGVGFETRRGT